MVGLPARGKTYIARKITRYLKWVGVPTSLFNVGNYRRERIGAEQTHDFFDPSNNEGNRARLHMAIAALDDMLNWLNKGGRVAIYDATNSTRDRRSMIIKRCQTEGIQTVFVESICNDTAIIDKNIKETKTSSPEYVHTTHYCIEISTI
ncbi:6-phosphofructo-2-kinase 1 [Coelomomyces lativittatus]|nr:6-phosphofructo-2-kinase 1 [Coelomomyces lativittatus]